MQNHLEYADHGGVERTTERTTDMAHVSAPRAPKLDDHVSIVADPKLAGTYLVLVDGESIGTVTKGFGLSFATLKETPPLWFADYDLAPKAPGRNTTYSHRALAANALVSMHRRAVRLDAEDGGLRMRRVATGQSEGWFADRTEALAYAERQVLLLVDQSG